MKIPLHEDGQQIEEDKVSVYPELGKAQPQLGYRDIHSGFESKFQLPT